MLVLMTPPPMPPSRRGRLDEGGLCRAPCRPIRNCVRSRWSEEVHHGVIGPTQPIALSVTALQPPPTPWQVRQQIVLSQDMASAASLSDGAPAK